MTGDRLMTILAAGIAGAAIARGLATLRLQAPPERLMRTNVSGLRVPAVLGGIMAVAALATMAGVQALAGAGWGPARTGVVGAAVALVVVLMALAGIYDDARGDEAARGFRGHLTAAGSGRLTGGVVKLAAGGAAGLGAGALVADGRAVIEVALLVGLGANLVNLVDRAPGRAAKLTLLSALPLVVWGDPSWAVAAAGLFGALAGCVPLDLRERAMLGDAGANPLGAVIGLGLGLSLPEYPRVAAIAVLVALNLASERWSFSRGIERVPALRALDALGRRPGGPDPGD